MARKKRLIKTNNNTIKKKQSETGKDNTKKPAETANRTYKDSLFTDLFYSDVTAEENLRSLYNALHPEDMLRKGFIDRWLLSQSMAESEKWIPAAERWR